MDRLGAPPTIDGYVDLVYLGHGATSVVYRALEVEFDRRVAVKVLDSADPAESSHRRFAQEKALIGRLSGHPHIVQVFKAGATADGRPFVSMQLYDGSVQDELDTRGSFRVEDAVAIMAAIADAAAAAHAVDIIHRDIKPKNVLLAAPAPGSGPGRLGPGLADFGIARAATRLDQTLSLAQLTPWHSAPEAFDDAPPTVQADVWSLGSTLYTMLAGRPPFAGSPSESLTAYRSRLEREPVPHIPRNDLPDGLRHVIATALAKSPSERFATAAAFRAALLALPVTVGPGGLPGGTLGPDTPPAAVMGDPGHAAAHGPAAVPGPEPGSGAGPGVAGDQATVTRIRHAPPARPEPDGDRSSRWRRGAVVITVVVATLAALGAAAAIVLPDDGEGGGGRAGSTTTAPTLAFDPSLAPADLTVDDHGDTVDLRWTDRSGGRLTYLVFVFRDRVEEPAEQTVPVDPGLDAVTIRGLDPAAPYCFRVLGIGRTAGGERFETAADQQVRGCLPEPLPTTPTTSSPPP